MGGIVWVRLHGLIRLFEAKQYKNFIILEFKIVLMIPVFHFVRFLFLCVLANTFGREKS